MMDETHLINKVKESTCYISQDFQSSLENIKHKTRRVTDNGGERNDEGGEVKYILPDYSNSKEGYILKEGQSIKEDQQVLVLGNERFAVPELLFTPSDVGTSPTHPSGFLPGYSCSSWNSGFSDDSASH
jgi:actin-related protein 6